MRALPMLAATALLMSTAPLRADGTTDLVRNLVDGNVIPAYQAFAEATAALAHSIEHGCATGSPTGEDQRSAFAAAWTAWAGARHVAKGPVTFYDRVFRIEFWPDTRNRTERELADLRAASAVAIPKASVAVQGFPALERVLYADDPAATDCPIATGISDNLKTMAAGIARDWTDGPTPFRQTLVAPGLARGVYATSEEALAALLVGVTSSLEGVARLRLGRPLGDGAEKPRPNRAEAWRSRLSMDLVRADLAAVSAFYLNQGTGIDQALRDGGHGDLADLMSRAFATTNETAGKIGSPLAEAVTRAADRAVLEALVAQVGALKTLIEQDVAPALGIPAGFNALDGD